jgi:hypothetical protein
MPAGGPRRRAARALAREAVLATGRGGNHVAASNLPGLRLVRQRGPWALRAALAAVALRILQRNARRYHTALEPTTEGGFWPRRWELVTRIAGGMTALRAGLAPLGLGPTGRIGAPHRTLGRVDVAALLVGSAAACDLALTVEPKDVASVAGRYALSTAWVAATGIAIVAVRRRSIEQQREWMLRGDTVTFAVVTFRLGEKRLLPWRPAGDDGIDIVMA